MKTAQTIVTVLTSVYGVSEIEADAITVEWAAARLAETVGADKAAKAWKRLNAKRYRLGRHTTIPAWGTPLHAAYFA